jgi:hypothetical protein
MEKLYNLVTATLSGNVSVDATSIPISSSSLMPIAGNYRVIVDAEIMIVSARDGNNLIVTRAAELTVAATHPAGAVVTLIASAGGLSAIRAQPVLHTNSLLFASLPANAVANFHIDLSLLSADRTLIAPNKDGVIATLEDVATGGITPATATVLGGILVGPGLSVNSSGLLSAKVASVNNKAGGAVVLDATDVGAVDLSSINVAGGVPGLSALPTVTPANHFQYGRTLPQQLPAGALYAPGTWNPSINTASNYVSADGNSYVVGLASGGMATFTHLTDTYTVPVPGWTYLVTTTATVTLDDYTEFDNGDIITSLNGKWQKLRSSTAPVDTATALANSAIASASAAATQASAAMAAATSQPIADVGDASSGFTIGAGSNKGHIFVNRTTANVNFTIPKNATTPLPIGYVTVIHHVGAAAGTATLVLEDGAATTLTGKVATTAVNDHITLVKRGLDVWYGY